MANGGSVQALCDEARELLSQAWRKLVEAQLQATEDGDPEKSKALASAADLASQVGVLCIALPRLHG